MHDELIKAAQRIDELEEEVTKWQEVARGQAVKLVEDQNAFEALHTYTLHEWIWHQALGQLGVSVETADIEAAVTFLAGSGFLTPDQYEEYRSSDIRYLTAVLDTPLIALITAKSAQVRGGQALMVSPREYEVLGAISTHAAAHANYATKCKEADTWAVIYQEKCQEVEKWKCAYHAVARLLESPR